MFHQSSSLTPAPLLSPLQENTPIRGQPECLMELTGQDLIGVPVRSPNATHDRVYVLPLLTILTNKGTGVVTSVPSDSPDDYMALQVSGGVRAGRRGGQGLACLGKHGEAGGF